MDRLPPIHPGEVLLEDFMKPLGLTQYRVAKDIGVSPLRISQIVRGQRAITADTALRWPGIWAPARPYGCVCRHVMIWKSLRN